MPTKSKLTFAPIGLVHYLSAFVVCLLKYSSHLTSLYYLHLALFLSQTASHWCRYLATHGGSSNATTSMEHTWYNKERTSTIDNRCFASSHFLPSFICVSISVTLYACFGESSLSLVVKLAG